MNGLKILLAGAVLLLAAPSAMGASVESRERAAKKACLVGDVDKGSDILADLYVETSDSGYIYNQARCFEQNGKNVQSALRFKEYLRKAKNLSQADIDAVLKKIDELQGAAGNPAAQPAPAPLPPPAAQPSAALTASAVPPSAAVATTAAPQPEATAMVYASSGATPPDTEPGLGLRTTGVVAIAVGGAALATGVVFSVLVNKTAKDIESQTNQSGGANWSSVSGKYSDGGRYQTLQWVSYGVGATASIAGGVLYWMGSRSAATRVSSTQVFPVFMANGAGAGLHLAF